MSIEARRHSPRVKLNESACINFGLGNQGVVLDVSEGGLRFQSDSPVQAGEQISFSFTNDHRSEAAAELAWSNESGEISGLRFTNLPPELYKQIRAWMDQGLCISKVLWQTPPTNGESAPCAAMTAHQQPVEEHTRGVAVDYVVAPEPSPSVAIPSAAEAKSEQSTLRTDFDVASKITVAGIEGNFSMFPVETKATGGHNRLALATSIVLFLLAAATGAVTYFYPNQAHDAMSRVQAKIIEFIKPLHRQPISSTEPAVMGATPANDPRLEATVEPATSASGIIGVTDDSNAALEATNSVPHQPTKASSSTKVVSGDNRSQDQEQCGIRRNLGAVIPGSWKHTRSESQGGSTTLVGDGEKQRRRRNPARRPLYARCGRRQELRASARPVGSCCDHELRRGEI